MNDKKAVFLDIDGTLITFNGEFPESAKEALRKARENGHYMLLCTGRAKVQILNWFPLDLIDGIISCAGACVTIGDVPVYEKVMDAEHVQKLIDYCKENGLTYFLQTEKRLVTEQWAKDAMAAAFRKLGKTEEEVTALVGRLDAVDDPAAVPGVEKGLFYNCRKPFPQICEELGDYYNITDSSFKVTRFCDAEITCRGIDKAVGMQKALDYLGVSHENSIAFGDGPNDFEMIEYAGTGIAMGNAIPGLKEKADRVCGNVDNDGLYNEFKELGLI